jgi:hypothetical protein
MSNDPRLTCERKADGRVQIGFVDEHSAANVTVDEDDACTFIIRLIDEIGAWGEFDAPANE